MESIYLIVSIFLLTGRTVSQTRYFFEPIRNIFGPVQSENEPTKVIHSFLLPFRKGADNQASEFGPVRTHESSKSWWNNTPAKPIIPNIFNEPPTASPDHHTKSYDHTEPTDILNSLNAMKDKVKQSKDHDNEQTPNPTDLNDRTPSIYNSGETTNANIAPDGKKILRPVTKKEFFIQAQVVRPVGADKQTNETVYYVNV